VRVGDDRLSQRCVRRRQRDPEDDRFLNAPSASVRTAALVLETSIRSSAFGPTSSPKATNTIVGVTGVPDRRRDTAATPSSASATSATGQPMSPIVIAAPDAGENGLPDQ
jgi:hypothetical protein